MEKIAKNVLKNINKRGIVQYRNIKNGKFVKSTGEYTSYSKNMHSGSSRPIAPTIKSSQNNNLIPYAAALTLLATTVISTGGLALYKKYKQEQEE